MLMAYETKKTTLFISAVSRNSLITQLAQAVMWSLSPIHYVIAEARMPTHLATLFGPPSVTISAFLPVVLLAALAVILPLVFFLLLSPCLPRRPRGSGGARGAGCCCWCCCPCCPCEAQAGKLILGASWAFIPIAHSGNWDLKDSYQTGHPCD